MGRTLKQLADSRVGPRIRGAAVILLSLLAAVTAEGQTARDNVAVQLKVVTAAKADEGFTPDQEALGRSVLLGVLEHEASVHLELTLNARRAYHIAARCDTGCANIDIRLLGPDFMSLAEDTLENDAPKMEFTPRESGQHLLAVQMTTCAARICYFGIVVLSRPVP